MEIQLPGCSNQLVGRRILNIGSEGPLFEKRLDGVELMSVEKSKAGEYLRRHAFDLVLFEIQGCEGLAAELGMIRTVGPDRMGLVTYGSLPLSEILGNCPTVALDEHLCWQHLPSEAIALTHQLVWVLSKVLDSCRQRTDARQWESQQRQQAANVEYEVLHQLRSQRSVIFDLASDVPLEVSEWLVQRFVEILKCQLISTSSDVDEISGFAQSLRQADVTLTECLLANSLATERVLLGLGGRRGWFAIGQSHRIAVQTMWVYQSCIPVSKSAQQSQSFESSETNTHPAGI